MPLIPPSQHHYRDEHEEDADEAGRRLSAAQTPELEQAKERMNDIARKVATDSPLRQSDIGALGMEIGNFAINVGPCPMSLREIKNIPDFETNRIIWENLMEKGERSGIMDVRRLTYLPVSVAKTIGDKWRLANGFFRNLKTISPEALNEMRSMQYLGLPALPELSDDLARVLSRHTGDLTLGPIKPLTTEQAAMLKLHSGGLNLSEMLNPGDDVIEELVQIPYPLSLGITSLTSIRTAKALGKHRGSLALKKLGYMSHEAARELKAHTGELRIGWKNMPMEILEEIVEAKGPLELVFTTLTPEQAHILARHKGGHVTLNDLSVLSLEAAEALIPLTEDLQMPALRLEEERDAIIIRTLVRREPTTEIHYLDQSLLYHFCPEAREEKKKLPPPHA